MENNPHDYFKHNERQGTQFDQDTNGTIGTLHQNDSATHYDNRTLTNNDIIAGKDLIDTGANAGICYGNSLEYDHDGSNDLYFYTITIQVNDIKIAHNNITIDESNYDHYLIHNREMEEDNLTNNDQDDDDQFVKNNNDTLKDDGVWQFQEITAHHRVPPDDPQYQRGTYIVRILWDIGELTDESLYSFGRDASIECAIYASRHGLSNKPG